MAKNQQLRELLNELMESRNRITDDLQLVADRFQPLEEYPLNRERFQVIQELLSEVVDDLQRTVNKDSATWVHTVSDYSELLDYIMRELEELGEKEIRGVA